MKENRKALYSFVALALVLSIVGISVGFAAMSTELRINGSANVVPASWKIKFSNLSAPTISGAATVTTAPTIQSDTHIGNYEVELSKPGDSVVYTFDVVNDGSIDAELSTYTFATPTITGTGATADADATIVQSNLVYTLTYADGTAIQQGDELANGETKSLKLTVGYSSTAETLPTNAVEIGGMDVTFVYGQK